MTNLYGIMIKYPEPGKVKTRLAKDVGHEKAAEVYKHLVDKVMKNTRPSFIGSPFIQPPPLPKGGWGDLSEESRNNQISPTPSFPKRGISDIPLGAQNCEMMYERIIFYDPPERLPDFETWFPGEEMIQQRGHDVGVRMDNVIRDLLDMGAKKAVITGADIPDLTSVIIMEAFTALDSADVVVGPARDGGYYLIGMKAPHPEIFQNMPWSTGRVLEETMRIIRKLQLRCASITTLSDLDTEEDYKRLSL
jgi:rSAM/selenodomain-associated transferase 1